MIPLHKKIFSEMNCILMFFFLTTSCVTAIQYETPEVRFGQSTATVLTPLQLKCSFEKAEYVPISITILKGDQDVIASFSQETEHDVSYHTKDVSIRSILSNNNFTSLTVSWKNVSQSQIGQYSCIVQARHKKQVHLYRSSLDVYLSEPSFEDLISFTKNQAFLQDEQNSLLQQLSKQLKEQEDELKVAFKKISKVNVDLSEIRPQVEEGIAGCGPSTTYTRPADDQRSYADWCAPKREQLVTVLFQTPFPKAPSVSLLLRYLDMVNNSRLSFVVSSVNSTSFQFVCTAYCETLINDMHFHWIARIN